MAQIPIINATTSAVTKREVNLLAYESGIIAADALAGAEEVDIFLDVGGSWETLVDKDGNTQKLTATKTMLVLEGGAHYAIDKDATAGACAVFVNFGRGLNG